MSERPPWLSPLLPHLPGLDERGVVAVASGPVPADDLSALASERGWAFVEADGALSRLVERSVGRSLTGSFAHDSEFCRDAVGDAEGAALAWQAVLDGWRGELPQAAPVAPYVRELRRADQALTRVLAEVGAVEPRVALVRGAARLGDGDRRVLQSLLADGAVGWLVVLEGPVEGPAADLMAALARLVGDERAQPAHCVDLNPPELASPGLPKRGSALELLDILASAPCPLPADVVGSDALAHHRGAAPRSGWLDLQGVVESGRARLSDGWVVTDEVRDGLLAEADRRALGQALSQAEGAAARAGALLRGEHGVVVGSIRRGEWAFALEVLGPGDGDPVARCRALRQSGRGAEVRRLAKAFLPPAGEDARPDQVAVRIEYALSSTKERTLRKHLAAAVRAAQQLDAPELLACAALCLGESQSEDGDGVAAAKTLAHAVRVSRDEADAARAQSLRALAMARAGARERAVEELGKALERIPDVDDPRSGAIAARVLLGLVFREAGSREKARRALAMAAEIAQRHCAPVEETEARLHLARFHLEGMPAQGKERGEAMRDAREAAEGALHLARRLGLHAQEAEAEAVLSELSWRAEAWAEAAESLQRQAAAWGRAGRGGKQLDTLLRMSRLSAQREQHEDAFGHANKAMQMASKARMTAGVGQAQMARGEALAGLGRKDEALAAFSEAERLFGSLGDGHAAQARGAANRAQELVKTGR